MAKAKQPTRPVRLHEDVAELADQLAPIFGESTPDFLSNLLRPVLENLRPKAAEKILGAAKEPHKPRRRPTD